MLLVLFYVEVGGVVRVTQFLYSLGEVEGVVFYYGVEMGYGKHFWNIFLYPFCKIILFSTS